MDCAIIKLLKRIYHKICKWLWAILYKLSPVLMARYRFLLRKGSLLQLNHPKTFDEKLLWLMLYWRHPLKTKCGDKYAMRSYVADHGLSHILPKLLGVYESADQIDFDALPHRFVIKCSHGCGFNIICNNKGNLNIKKTKQQLNKWLKKNYSETYGEIHYAQMQPKIICEQFLDDLASDLPCDYKVYCFDGKALFTMACTERGMDNGNTKFDYYDREWNTKLPYSRSSLLANRSIPKPEGYEEIITAAEKLSRPFPFVRMDFYSIKGRAVLGEMTFTPAGCIDTGYTDYAQQAFGKMITLPKKFP